MKRRHGLLLTAIVVLTLCGVYGVWLYGQQQQVERNRRLIDALARGDNETALALVKAGADPNTRYLPDPAPSLKRLLAHLLHHTPNPVNDSPTAFILVCGAHWAFANGKQIFPPPVDEDPALLQTMLDHGANIHARAWNGLTALHDAVGDERRRTVELLLKHGADVNARTRWGQTPLMLTAGHDNVNIARLLLAHHADPNAQDINGDTVLFWAIESPIARTLFPELLARGADPNLRDRFGSTPLIMAQTSNHPELVRLFRAGARR